MAPKYKLTFLDSKSLAEPIRLLLEYAGADWEDIRIEKGPQVQEIGPFGKVPVLEVDGKKLHQSVAICRYLAKQFKLAGDSDWEALQIDMIVDTIGDIRQEYKSIVASLGTKEEIDKKKDAFFNEWIHKYMEILDSIVKENGGYFVNGKLTWADFYYAHMADAASCILGETATIAIDSKFPHLCGVKNKIFALPAIKAWVAKRAAR